MLVYWSENCGMDRQEKDSLMKYALLDDLKSKAGRLGIQIASIVVDSIFLSLWVAIQYSVDRFIVKKLGLSGVDQWMLITFQVIFALATLAPVIIYVYVDIRVMIIRAGRQIRQEAQSDEASGNVGG